ncbi:hypothetical protein F5B20DRAFT_537914 [Whalleya microplaca]|nr:hypothetical protein F5B20DRAFT_537914 [Whalleya microplaca]
MHFTCFVPGSLLLYYAVLVGLPMYAVPSHPPVCPLVKCSYALPLVLLSLYAYGEHLWSSLSPLAPSPPQGALRSYCVPAKPT